MTDELQRHIAALEAELAALRAQQQPQQGGNDFREADVKRIDRVIGGDAIDGDKVLGNKTVIQPADTPLSRETLLRGYLDAVIATASHLTFTEVDNTDLEQQEVLLEDVYTGLEVAGTATAARPDDEPGERQRQLSALEALLRQRKLVLLGPPGSGKSTLVRFLTLCLARAERGETAWLQRLGAHWSPGSLLPIRIELRDFANWLLSQEATADSGELFWNYLAARVATAPGLAPLLRERASQGQAAILLDGLDEVAADAQGEPLNRLKKALDVLGTMSEVPLLLITCRVLDYEEPRRQMRGWPVEKLIPFSEELQQQFIDRWYGTLARLQRTLIGDPDDLRLRLRAAITTRPDLRRIAGNPLLLTMMALLHASKGRLPEKRVELYAESLDLLLRRWRRAPGRPALEEELGIPGWHSDDTDQLLNHLGYAAHSLESSAAQDDERVGATLTRDTLITTAAALFRQYQVQEPFRYAERFCDYIGAHSNGILQQHGPDSFRFPHRTFQEFLAARRLVDDLYWEGYERDRLYRLRAKAGSAQWREVLLLAVSQLLISGQQRTVVQLVQDLLGEHRKGSKAWAANSVIAGEILTQAERKQFAGLKEERLWDETAEALRRVVVPTSSGMPILRNFNKPLLELPDRIRGGVALSVLGDPRLGVESLEPQWCDVPAGPFLLGSTNEDKAAIDWEKPQRTVDLPGFRISRYPITNAQWRLFIEDGGYQDRRWWSEAGWASKEQSNWTKPDYLDDPRFNGGNQPVVGISWYEAWAFCRWLSVKVGYPVRLPSEAEWEKAARGDDGRIYPWGNRWDAAKANTQEGQIGATTPVGCYLDGASPYGALDMAGNVFEWTATPWQKSYQNHDGTERQEDDGEAFVWRGGAWSFVHLHARCACRGSAHPSLRINILGARVVAALTDGQ